MNNACVHQKVEAQDCIKSSLAHLVRQWTSDPEVRCKVGVQALVRIAVCSDEGLTLKMLAKHHIPRAKNISYQPLLIKPIFNVLTHTKKQFFSKLVFQGPLVFGIKKT